MPSTTKSDAMRVHEGTMTPERFEEIVASIDRGDAWDRTAVDLVREVQRLRSRLAALQHKAEAQPAAMSDAMLVWIQELEKMLGGR